MLQWPRAPGYFPSAPRREKNSNPNSNWNLERCKITATATLDYRKANPQVEITVQVKLGFMGVVASRDSGHVTDPRAEQFAHQVSHWPNMVQSALVPKWAAQNKRAIWARRRHQPVLSPLTSLHCSFRYGLSHGGIKLCDYSLQFLRGLPDNDTQTTPLSSTLLCSLPRQQGMYLSRPTPSKTTRLFYYPSKTNLRHYSLAREKYNPTYPDISLRVFFSRFNVAVIPLLLFNTPHTHSLSCNFFPYAE